MPNVLPTAKRGQVLKTLCQGVSMRGTAELCDVSMNAVVKLLADAGEACMWAHDDLVVNVKASKIQCDEVWSFTYAKQKNVATAKAAEFDATYPIRVNFDMNRSGAGMAWDFFHYTPRPKIIACLSGFHP